MKVFVINLDKDREGSASCSLKMEICNSMVLIVD